MRLVMFSVLAVLFGVSISPARADDVTVVIALEPTKFSGKRWDVDRGADPVVCLGKDCYRSEGLDWPARLLSAKRALGPFAALNLGGKAGACTDRLVCVFRGVPLDDGPLRMTPIDLDIDRHDRLEERFIAADRSCRVKHGRLDCYNGIYAREYSAWIVPEAMAQAAGADGLDWAMNEGIRNGRARFAEEFLSQEREAMPQRIEDFYRLVLGAEVDKACRNDAELMAATIKLAGIGTAPGSSASAALNRFIHGRAEVDMIDTIRTEPRVFWGLQQAIDRFRSLVSVEEIARNTEVAGLRTLERDGRLVLEVGWQTEEQARDLLDRCEGIDATDLDSIFKIEGKS